MSRAKAMALIKAERQRQDDRWGRQHHEPFVWLSILTEEVGESHEAALHDKFGGEHRGTFEQEIVQVAAVALAILEQCV